MDTIECTLKQEHYRPYQAPQTARKPTTSYQQQLVELVAAEEAREELAEAHRIADVIEACGWPVAPFTLSDEQADSALEVVTALQLQGVAVEDLLLTGSPPRRISPEALDSLDAAVIALEDYVEQEA